jgi:hypothetical protein
MSDFNIEKYNEDVKRQAFNTRRRIKSMAMRMTVRGKTQLLKEVKSARARSALLKRIKEDVVLSRGIFTNFGKVYGEIDRIGYKFPLHGIYMHHGVSRGHPAGSPRKRKDWFNRVLDDDIPKLADVVAKHYADAALNSTRMKIN